MYIGTNRSVNNFSITTNNDTDIFTFTLQYPQLSTLKKFIKDNKGHDLWAKLGEMFKQIHPYMVNNLELSSVCTGQLLNFLISNETIIKGTVHKELSKIADEKYKLILNIPDNLKLSEVSSGVSHIDLFLSIYFVSNQDRVSYAIGGFNVQTIGFVKEATERRVFNLNKVSSKAMKC